jgi:hypothetical protein
MLQLFRRISDTVAYGLENYRRSYVPRSFATVAIDLDGFSKTDPAFPQHAIRNRRLYR